MTTSPGELDRFLAELSVRRQRLLRLVGPEASTTVSPQAPDLVAELQDLSEQLIIAEEELRVQQEELDTARAQIEAITAESVALFENSSAFLVITDVGGVVLQTTRAASGLMRQWGGRRMPRPIATWFESDDRRRVRTLISSRNSGKPLTLQGLVLRRSDGSTVVTDVHVTPTRSPAGPALLWELIPAVANSLGAVPDLYTESAGPSLAARITELTARLAAVGTLPETLLAIADEAVRMVPGVEYAIITGTDRRGAQQVLATGGPATDERAADEPAADELTVPLGLPDRVATTLHLCARQPDTFGPQARSIADLLAVHFQVATGRAAYNQNLEQAIATRQEIGEAVGVLVERRRITRTVAFDELVARSKETNLKLREVARIIVETGQEPGQVTA